MGYGKILNGGVGHQVKLKGEKQVVNNAGGMVYEADQWVRLNRFLILGTEENTYYVGKQEMTALNVENVARCWHVDPGKTLRDILDISFTGRAQKNSHAVLAMAVGVVSGDDVARRYVYKELKQVCRTASMLFEFLSYVKALREKAGQPFGQGQGFKRAIGRWYNSFRPEQLAYQIVKYRSRDGWTHEDVLRAFHPIVPPGQSALLRTVIKGEVPADDAPGARLIKAFLDAYRATELDQVVAAIGQGLPWEAVDTKWLNAKEAWDALLDFMPDEALVSNLGQMTSKGVFADAQVVTYVAQRIRASAVKASRPLHPMSAAVAHHIYSRGHGFKGQLTWEPVAAITQALEAALYASASAAVPTGKRILLAIDASGSMQSPMAGMADMTSAQVGSIIALTMARIEPRVTVLWFDDAVGKLDIGPEMTLSQVRSRAELGHGAGTDCSLPYYWAMERRHEVDAFVLITDSESWHNVTGMQPVEALRRYRAWVNRPDVRSVTVATTATQFTTADPADRYSLNVAGMDASVPKLITEFISGNLPL